jgi:hypothetical protein
MTEPDKVEPADQTSETIPDDEEAKRTGHEGSAAPQLTGREILATWISSVIVHLALFVTMFMVPWLTQAASRPPDLPEPNVQLVGDVAPVSFSPSQVPDLSQDQTVSPQEEIRFDPKEFEGVSDAATKVKPDLAVIGIGTGGGDFSKFGLSVGGGRGPRFFGLGENATGARRIVYVVDRSGSMTDTFDFVRQELKRSISALRRSQKFHVIFFSAGKPVENPPKRPVSAIRAQKEQFFDFLDSVYTGGRTDPTPAMIRAFDCEPDLIYFLTDGEFDRALIGRLDKINRDRKVRIFAIAYFNREGADLLRTIAREHRGEFKFVSEDDLP